MQVRVNPGYFIYIAFCIDLRLSYFASIFIMEDNTLYQRLSPADPTLRFYIDAYVLFQHNEGLSMQKHYLPCPRVSLLFNFSGLSINHQKCAPATIIGLHENIYSVESETDKVETLIVQFSPWGCRQFISEPVSILTNKITDARTVFGDSLKELFNGMRKTDELHQRVRLLDQYFLARTNIVDPVDKAVADIAAQLLESPEPLSFTSFNKNHTLPLSERQMARRFKDIIGVNLQTYIRICRFSRARWFLFQQNTLNLTDIGYLSGYYDQAHFSKEFKKLSGANAKYFTPVCALSQKAQRQ
jgi:hypothetical protein